jgi:hypothetical protein
VNGMLTVEEQHRHLRLLCDRVEADTGGTRPTIRTFPGDVAVATFGHHVEIANAVGTYDLWVDGNLKATGLTTDVAVRHLIEDA